MGYVEDIVLGAILNSSLPEVIFIDKQQLKLPGYQEENHSSLQQTPLDTK